MLSIQKTYSDLPFGHRQYRHQGHCRYVHGHNLSVQLTFCAHHRDDNGFVVDFGGLQSIKKLLADQFDHTLLISHEDPELLLFKKMHADGLCDLRVAEGSAEDIVRWIFEKANLLLRKEHDGRVWLHAATVWEDSKNSATYSPNGS